MGLESVFPILDEEVQMMARRRPDLPLLDLGVRRERADAARNRRKVLEAARSLFDARGVDQVTMDEVAGRAGVGKGTLYRRFGDRSGLAAAVLDEVEAALQQAMLSGPPPLGPGAAPLRRLVAFVRAYLRLLDDNRQLVLVSQTASPGARFRTGSHQLWHLHCRTLLDEAGAADPELRADALMSLLTAEQLRHWQDDRGLTRRRLLQPLNRLCEALAGS
jgi:AcrR family transcriptional regulator